MIYYVRVFTLQSHNDIKVEPMTLY